VPFIFDSQRSLMSGAGGGGRGDGGGDEDCRRILMDFGGISIICDEFWRIFDGV